MSREEGTDGSKEGIDLAAALRFVVLLGIVSMFADATYESSRSITGPYLATLGASAAIVGIVAGLSELADYGLRFLSGYLTDRTRKYWLIAFIGFGLNMAAVPLLALAVRWEMAAALILAERTGKAIRNPARDTMLSYATRAFGHGRSFGLQEALGQVGAVVGPLVVAALLHFRYSYRFCLSVLVVPAVATLGVLIFARKSFPHPDRFEARSAGSPSGSWLPPRFWLFLGVVALMASGYVDYPLIAFHFRKSGAIPGSWIPAFYAVAMGTDAVAALAFGHFFDQKGITVLLMACLVSSLAAPLALWGGFSLAMLGMALWGVGLGGAESHPQGRYRWYGPVGATGHGLRSVQRRLRGLLVSGQLADGMALRALTRGSCRLVGHRRACGGPADPPRGAHAGSGGRGNRSRLKGDFRELTNQIVYPGGRAEDYWCRFFL